MHAFLRLIPGLTLALLLGAGLPGLAQAQANSADSAAQQALAKLGGNGKVLSVREKTGENGKRYFEVQVISKGNVRIFSIPRS